MATSDGEIKQILQTLPHDLAETYARILDRKRKSKGGFKKLATAMKIFRWIVCARRPLLMEELKEAISIELTDTHWDSEKIPKA